MEIFDDVHVGFDDWTKTRIPAVIGTNAGSEPLAFQGWRHFKEAFVPELILRAARETSEVLGRPVRTCLDPFAGSGTTPLACQFLGIHPIAIEVNPFLADLIEAKLAVVDEAIVARRCGELIATSAKVDPLEFYANAPSTFVEPGVNGRYLFPMSIAQRLATLVSATDRLSEEPIARLLRVLLASAAVEVCNAVVSGKGRRYRKNWHETQRTASDFDKAFIISVQNAVYDIARYAKRKLLKYDLKRGDSRKLVNDIPEIDLAVFSPPYPNSFDYTDVYNIELWALGYLRHSTHNLALRQATMRSHVQIKRDFSFSCLSPTIDEAITKLKSAPGLWNKNIPDMIGAYFADLSLILKGIRKKIRAGGRVYMVVGDSRYANIDIPVASALNEMALDLGFSPVSTEPFRSMRSSPQQGGRLELPETLLVFSAI